MKNLIEINKKEALKVSGGGFGKEWAKLNKVVDKAARDVGDAARDAEREVRKSVHKTIDERNEERDKKDTENVGVPEEAPKADL